MREKAGDNIWLDYPSVKEILKRNFHNLPNVYYYITLKDMEELGLIRKVGNNPRIRYELIAKDIDKLLHDYNHTF
jgi:UDP-N-acetylglucosamine pyrophosphorylase